MLSFIYESNATDLPSARCTVLSYRRSNSHFDVIYNFLFFFSPPFWLPPFSQSLPEYLFSHSVSIHTAAFLLHNHRNSLIQDASRMPVC